MHNYLGPSELYHKKTEEPVLSELHINPNADDNPNAV